MRALRGIVVVVPSIITIRQYITDVPAYSPEQGTVEEFVSLFRVVPVNAEIAKAGGLCKSKFGKSHGVGLADAILAATVEAENAELKTLNTKHYPMLKGLTPAYKK